ncbi:metal-dependent hydrolase [Aneurinibacillus terranovensis]|uniref:metal-dependent hydrolase n=1 Tax=Aneurinibacillus terranovensis TaxID=278991 RepID=UPI00041E6113|nr:metal-dependent hydrolase [Aneurinibacillus terranovensis]
MEILYHGHSCVQLSHKGKSIIIDPFFTGNSLATAKPEEIEAQYVLLTHAHSDHIADAVTIAKRNNATIIAIHELATYMAWQGIEAHGMNLGGAYDFDFGRVKMTQAFHSSGFVDEEKKEIIYMGMPAGFLVTMGGKTVYHTGDTGLFGDLKLIGDRHKINVAFLPIGDNFTMGPEDALLAAEWINASVTVPIHYNTFQPIKQDAHAFIKNLEAQQLRGKIMEPGEKFQI